MKQARTISLILLCVFLQTPLAARALTLAEGLRFVAANGRDVQIARSDRDQAQSAVSLARARWLPSIDLYGQETWLQNQPEAKFGPQTVPTSQDHFTVYGVQATQLLYDFGKTGSSISAAQYDLQSREIAAHRARGKAVLGFIIAYLNLLESNKLLQVEQEEVKRYEAHDRDAEARLAAGVATRNETLQAEVTLADARQRLLSAENAQSLQESRINSLLLRPLNDPVQPEEVQVSPAAGMTLEEAWTNAEASSSRLQELDAAIAAQRERISSTRAEYLPRLYLSGGYEYDENRYMVYQDNWSLVAGVTMNLFSGGGSAARIDMEAAKLQALLIEQQKTLDGVRLNVKQAYLDLQSSRQMVDVAKTAVAQAQENLRLLQLRYQQGVGTPTEVLDAVALLTTAESNSWKAKYGVQRAEATLLDATGADLLALYGK